MVQRCSMSLLIAVTATVLSACAPALDSSESAPLEDGEEVAASPRAFAALSGAAEDAAEASLFGGLLSGGCPGLGDIRVYVIVIDSLDPKEIGLKTPNLRSLRLGGTFYESARAVLPSSTTPNHAAMMTGVLPERSGIIDNVIVDAGGELVAQDDPAMFQQDTLFTRIEKERSCIETASILSVKAVSDLFRDDPGPGGQRGPDFVWEPQPLIPQVNVAPDTATAAAFLQWLTFHPHGPQFAFVNLSDVDSAGHVDELGGFGARKAGLVTADTQLGLIVDFLKLKGAWNRTVLMIVSDHSMDYSLPLGFISLQSRLMLAGYQPGVDFDLAPNGGNEHVYVHDAAKVGAVAAAVGATPGVDFVLTDSTSPSRADFGLDHDRAGDVIAFIKEGYRFSDPDPHSDPIPGNHGHATTQPSVVLVSGGHPRVRHGRVVQGSAALPTLPGVVGTMSVAPTVAALLDLSEPPGGYDAPALSEAFVGGL